MSASKPHKRLWLSPHGTSWTAESYEEALEMERDSLHEEYNRLLEQVQTLERKLRDAPLGGEGSHWADCWRSHIDCAAARVESLEEQLEAAHDKSLENWSRAESLAGLLEGEQARSKFLQKVVENADTTERQLREQLEAERWARVSMTHALALQEQLEAAQKALREFHEEMWTVQNGDDEPFVSSEGLRYMRSWFDRTRHLIGEDSNPASEPDAPKERSLDG